MTMLNVIELIVASMPLLHLGASVVPVRRVQLHVGDVLPQGLQALAECTNRFGREEPI